MNRYDFDCKNVQCLSGDNLLIYYLQKNGFIVHQICERGNCLKIFVTVILLATVLT